MINSVVDGLGATGEGIIKGVTESAKVASADLGKVINKAVIKLVPSASIIPKASATTGTLDDFIKSDIDKTKGSIQVTKTAAKTEKNYSCCCQSSKNNGYCSFCTC